MGQRIRSKVNGIVSGYQKKTNQSRITLQHLNGHELKLRRVSANHWHSAFFRWDAGIASCALPAADDKTLGRGPLAKSPSNPYLAERGWQLNTFFTRSRTMFDDKNSEQRDLRYQAPPKEDETPAEPDLLRMEVGSSSLYGLTGKNITFHTPGATKEGFFTLLWHWAWKDLGNAFLGFFRIFLPSFKE